MFSLFKQIQKDRAYLVKVDDHFTEMKMPALLVEGLLHLNGTENRKNANMDKTFIKALIIGICTIKAIQNNCQIHKDLLIFMKGIFL